MKIKKLIFKLFVQKNFKFGIVTFDIHFQLALIRPFVLVSEALLSASATEMQFVCSLLAAAALPNRLCMFAYPPLSPHPCNRQVGI